MNKNGMAYIGENIDLLMEDRLCLGPYNFGITDEQIISSSDYHFRVSKYKFLRPELTLSMKGVKHRKKINGTLMRSSPLG